MRASKLALGLAAFWLITMASTFAYNLPTWCATPDVGSNHIVQPLCR